MSNRDNDKAQIHSHHLREKGVAVGIFWEEEREDGEVGEKVSVWVVVEVAKVEEAVEAVEESA